MMLVSQKHAVSLVCFDFFSEYQDSNSANRVSHFVLTGKKELKKGDSATDTAPSHGYLDSEDISSTRFWNPRGLCIKPGMDVMVADASNCVIRQLSRGHMTLAKAVQQVRTPRSNAQSLASSKNAGSKRASSRSNRRSFLTANKRKSQNKNNSIIYRNIKSVQNYNGNKSKVAQEKA